MPSHTPGEVVTTADKWGGGERSSNCWDSATLLFALQDLAWMLSFYVRFFFTYMPLLGLKGLLGLLFLVR